MLNRVASMHAQIRQIKFIIPVRSFKKIGGEFRDEEAEGCGEVEGLTDFGVEFFEGYVFAVVGFITQNIVSEQTYPSG
jgi:hypothetical protein